MGDRPRLDSRLTPAETARLGKALAFCALSVAFAGCTDAGPQVGFLKATASSPPFQSNEASAATESFRVKSALELSWSLQRCRIQSAGFAIYVAAAEKPVVSATSRDGASGSVRVGDVSGKTIYVLVKNPGLCKFGVVMYPVA